jgi:O-acetyl-ADP-ribose deacetylase (regulator of RNase III)
MYMVEIEVRMGSLLEVEADAIVNPANSAGWMGGGAAGAIKRAAGQEVEKEAVAQAPIPVGSAVATSGGKSRFSLILHAPTMVRPAERIPLVNVRKATRAALSLADQKKIAALALPGMGTGVGGIFPDSAARVMVEEIRSFRPAHLRKVILIDLDPEMVEAWKKEKNRDNEEKAG